MRAIDIIMAGRYQKGIKGAAVGWPEMLGLPGSNGSNNILMNWYLLDPVNQRQRTEFNIGNYGPDRWYCYGGRAYVNESGLEIPNKTQIVQYIPLEYCEIGKTYTLSVKIADNVQHNESGFSRKASISFRLFSNYYSASTIASVTPDQKGINTLTFTISNRDLSDTMSWGINLDAGNGYVTESIVIEEVKLEEGEISTLANDRPPNKDEQLLLCKQWFQVFPDGTPLTENRFDYDPVMYKNPRIGTNEIGGVTCAVASCEYGGTSA